MKKFSSTYRRPKRYRGLSKNARRAVSRRGGFALPGSFGKPVMATPKQAAAARNIGKRINYKTLIANSLKSLGPAIARSAGFPANGPELAAFAASMIAQGIINGSTKVKSVDPTESQPFSRESPYGLIEENSKGSLVKNGGTFTAKKYKTMLKTGYRTTKGVRTAASAYGTYKLQPFNTISEFISTPTVRGENAGRMATSATFGFNQKAFILLNSQWCTHVEDVRNEFDLPSGGSLTPYFTAKNQYERVYGLATQADTSFKISNSNQYFPVRVKLHLVSYSDEGTLPGLQLAQQTFANSITAGNQLMGRIPLRYQYGNIQPTSTHSKVLTSNRAKLTMSANFRNSCNIVNTTTKRLNPGDVWDYKIVESFGAGLDIAKLSLLDTNTPIYHSIVMEINGVDCEGVQQKVTPTEGTLSQLAYSPLGAYIGTSPGEVNFEMIRNITYVANPNPEFPLETDIGAGIKPKAAVKIYIEQPNPIKEYNVNHEEVGLPGEPNKTLFIPVISDKVIKFAESVTGTDATPSAMMTTNQILAQIRDALDPTPAQVNAAIALSEEEDEDQEEKNFD